MEFKCKDVGFNCSWTTNGNTEQEILQQCAVHAQKDHGIKPENIAEDLKNKIRANIH